MKQGPPPGPRQMPTHETKPKVLSFEEFSRRDAIDYYVPKYGNFVALFQKESTSFKTNKKYYKDFKDDYPVMCASLCDKIQNQLNLSKSGGSLAKALKPFDLDLYQAYKIMRQRYGVPDKELFA